MKISLSLKIGFSRLFVRETPEDWRMHVTQAIVYIIDMMHEMFAIIIIFTKANLLAKFVKISSLKNYRLYGIHEYLTRCILCSHG